MMDEFEIKENIKGWKMLAKAYKQEAKMGKDVEMNEWLHLNAKKEVLKLKERLIESK